MINIIKKRYFPRRYFHRINRAMLLLAGFVLSPLHAQTTGTEPTDPDQLHQRASMQMQQGNYAIAYCIWRPMAEHNDSRAQYNIGWMYHNGYGLAIDDETAFYWWIKSSAAGNTDAEYALGDLYLLGQGVEKDLSIALGWYIAAALKGHPAALETLHSLLKKDDPISRKIFRELIKTDWSLAGDAMQVRVGKANTRAGPGKQFKVINTLQRGHIVIPLRQQQDWTQIGITGLAQTGWIFSRLIEKKEKEKDTSLK